MKKAIQIHPADSVAVALQPLRRGEQIVLPSTAVTLQEDIPLGHKFALRDIDAGENIIKYGTIIGHAMAPIKAGEHVHTHNMKTNLSDILEYSYHPVSLPQPKAEGRTF